MTHHGDEHVDEYDDDGDVVEGKEEHAHPLDHRRGVAAPGETGGEHAVLLLLRILYLDAVDAHLTEHAPEERVERSWQALQQNGKLFQTSNFKPWVKYSLVALAKTDPVISCYFFLFMTYVSLSSAAWADENDGSL